MRILAIGALLCASPAAAQVVNPMPVDVTGINAAISAAQSKADQAKAAADAAAASIPQPASTTGPAEMPGGAAGSAMTYKRGDWTPVRLSRTGSCVLAAAGTCSGTWDGATAFPSIPRAVGDPAAINSTGAAPITCNFVSLSISGFSVKCWTQQPTTLPGVALSLLGLVITPYAATVAGNTVQATGITGS